MMTLVIMTYFDNSWRLCQIPRQSKLIRSNPTKDGIDLKSVINYHSSTIFINLHSSPQQTNNIISNKTD